MEEGQPEASHIELLDISMGPALLVGVALLRGLDFTSRLHGKSQPSYPGWFAQPITRANYIYFPTKPGIRYLRTSFHFITDT